MLRSMREAIRLNKRAIGIWWKESPGMLVSLLFYVVTGALLPYAGIYFPARIITERKVLQPCSVPVPQPRMPAP